MDKSNFVLFLKVLAAVIAGILSVLTVACVSSCSTVRHYTESKGRRLAPTCLNLSAATYLPLLFRLISLTNWPINSPNKINKY